MPDILGGIVATHLGCDGMFSDNFITDYSMEMLPHAGPRHDAPLIQLLIFELYILFTWLHPLTSLLLTYFSLLTFSFENRPDPFPGRRS